MKTAITIACIALLISAFFLLLQTVLSSGG